MPDKTYTYSISSDTKNGQVNLGRLRKEIRNNYSIIISLKDLAVSDDDLNITFLSALSSAEETELDHLVGDHSGQPLPAPETTEGIPYQTLYGENNKVQIVGRTGASDLIRTTHNFSDPTTWYAESNRVTESLTNPSGDGVTWESNNSNWIDLTHGKVHFEDKVRKNEPNGHGYETVITVDGTEQKEANPFKTLSEDSNADYEIDYANGTITFASEPSSAPEASYSYENGSGWFLYPKDGKVIEIESAEAQFTTSLTLKDTIRFAIEVPDGSGGWSEVGAEQYKTFKQLVDEAKGAFPDIVGLPGDRGITNDVYGFPFQYTAVRLLKSSKNMRLNVHLVDDTPFEGERATTTFYAVSYDE